MNKKVTPQKNPMNIHGAGNGRKGKWPLHIVHEDATMRYLKMNGLLDTIIKFRKGNSWPGNEARLQKTRVANALRREKLAEHNELLA